MFRTGLLLTTAAALVVPTTPVRAAHPTTTPAPVVNATSSLIGPTMGELKRTVRLGTVTAAAFTVTNGGTRAAQFAIGVQDRPGQSYTGPWQDIASLPVPLRDNAAAAGDGLVYSVGGTDGANRYTAANAYHPETNAWTPLPDMRVGREAAGAAFAGGKLYVVGGWTASQVTTASLEIYDSVRGTWSLGRSLPQPRTRFGMATLGGLIYVVGGCDTTCDHREVWRYDAARDTWKVVARYPVPVYALACSGILGYVYCAGGFDVSAGTGDGTGRGYRYDPVHNDWSRIADLPIGGYGLSYVATIDTLIVTAGVFQGEISGIGFAYRPASNTWTRITATDPGLYGGAAACGVYRAGGAGHDEPTAKAQVLRGAGSCGLDPAVPWISSVTPPTLRLAKGDKARVTVTLDASEVDRAGVYRAWLEFATDTAAGTVEVPVTLTVVP